MSKPGHLIAHLYHSACVLILRENGNNFQKAFDKINHATPFTLQVYATRF